MRKFTWILAVVLVGQVFAQTDSIEIDVERYTSGKNNISVLWLGSNLGINGYVDDSYSLALGTAGADWRLDQGRSWYFGLDIVESNFGLGTPIVNITTGLGFYIDQFSTYNALYGSIGALPIVMLTIFFIALAVIIGFELNVGIVAARKVEFIDAEALEE